MTIFISYDHSYTIKRLVKMWDISLRPKIRFIYYSDLPFLKTLPRDVTLFTDLERLSPAQLELACAAASQLRDAGVLICNEPSRVLCRYDLLRALSSDGVNEFNAYRLDDDRAKMKFPVFLRLENDHLGNLSDLIANDEELEAALKKAALAGHQNNHLLIVEYCATQDNDGVFRKYSAFMIGERLIPRHVFFSHGWVIKYAELGGEAKAREETEYVHQNPHSHEAPLRAIFRRAGIDFGRIDYSVKNGRIQVWEINTNPNIVPATPAGPERKAVEDHARRQISAAVHHLADQKHSARLSESTPRSTHRAVPFEVSSALNESLGISSKARRFHPIRRVLRPIQPARAVGYIKYRLTHSSSH